MKQNLKAFTLLELITAMSVSGILCIVALTIFNVITSQIDAYTEHANVTLEFHNLCSLIALDIDQSKNISADGQTLNLLKGQRRVTYLFQNNRISRSIFSEDLVRTDEFNFPSRRLQGNTNYMSSGKSRQSLSIEIQFQNRWRKLAFAKPLDVASQLNNSVYGY
ncbi:MAG: hypothetical protein AAF502_14575 [Bacteroidota bacterium]